MSEIDEFNEDEQAAASKSAGIDHSWWPKDVDVRPRRKQLRNSTDDDLGEGCKHFNENAFADLSSREHTIHNLEHLKNELSKEAEDLRYYSFVIGNTTLLKPAAPHDLSKLKNIRIDQIENSRQHTEKKDEIIKKIDVLLKNKKLPDDDLAAATNVLLEEATTLARDWKRKSRSHREQIRETRGYSPDM